MNTSVKINRTKMLSQWKSLRSTLMKNGINVEVMNSVNGLLDMVFAANAGMIVKNKVLVSRFKYPEREPEEEHFTRWFKEHNYSTYNLPRSVFWEGGACSIFFRDYFICSTGLRAHPGAYSYMQKIWGLKKENMVYFELLDPFFYHLDVPMTVLDNNTVMLCPLAFKQKDLEWLRSKIANIIEVSYDDALNFCCNALADNKQIFLNKGSSEEFKQKLTSIGYIPHELDMSEFIKSGGSVKCLVLKLENS